MIAKHILCNVKNDNYGHLARYIGNMKKNNQNESDEKILLKWQEGCEADEYSLAIKEIEATQSMNTTTNKEKTYHLLISFRPEDETKLTPEIFKKIENEIAKSLGFENHQRHCGVHKNTGNIHMHIAYNMINSMTFKKHTPYNDYFKLNNICRQLEEKYGLVVDNGVNANIKENKISYKAQNMEANTSQESLNTYILNKKQYILDLLEKATNWEDFHKDLSLIGLEIKKWGNGLVFKDLNGKHTVKASSIDRSLSFSNLEKKLGQFIKNKKLNLNDIDYLDKYISKPIQQNEITKDLYNEYKQNINLKKKELLDIRNEEQNNYNNLKEKWANKRKIVFSYKMLKTHRDDLLLKIKLEEEEERLQNKKNMILMKNEITKNVPYNNWVSFLQSKALEGNENALNLLRNKNINVQFNHNEKEIEKKKNELSIQTEIFEKKLIIEQLNTSSIIKKTLITVTKMEEAYKLLMNNKKLFKHESKETKTDNTEKIDNNLNCDDFKYNIDKKGCIIYNFGSNTGNIKDTGKEIYYSKNEECKQIALKYATLKWGKVSITQNKITPIFQMNKKIEIIR
jgi:hypothetical protein